MPCELDDAVMHHSDLLSSLMAFFLRAGNIAGRQPSAISLFQENGLSSCLVSKVTPSFSRVVCVEDFIDMCILRLGPFDKLVQLLRSPGFRAPLLELTKASVGTASWLLSFL